MASLVVKVKYEETLRRFDVAVNGEQQLDLSMEGLRVKICALFNLPADEYFRLTYNDEDGDLVTLVDDDDLNDLMRQGLNPVRITVHHISDKGAQSPYASGGSAEVPKALQVPLNDALNLRPSTQNSQQNANPHAVEILKSIQEPLTQAFSKISLDMSQEAASTSPILADLFDGLSKVGQSYMNATLPNSGDTSGSSHNVDGKESKPNADGIKHECFVNDIDSAVGEQPASTCAQASGIGASLRTPNPSKTVDKGKSVSFVLPCNKTTSNDAMKNNRDDTSQKQKELSRESQSNCVPNHSDEFSFAGTQLVSDETCKESHLSNRSLHKTGSLGSVFHKNVSCNGCGVLPITGIRFKSKVKYDYDLCGRCFSLMGNNFDYTRIDPPFRYARSFSASDARSPCPYMRKPQETDLPLFGFDSRFIMDVNVFDGTKMAPSTPFTKIWRMRNNGVVPWNHGLKFIWIGGDRFRLTDSVEIKVPSSGVNVASEINIAVDFFAPDFPGRYISYWRMAEPSGHKFGQPVWVQIQVDPSLDLTLESPKLNLNVPVENYKTPFPRVANVKVEPRSNVKAGESSASPFSYSAPAASAPEASYTTCDGYGNLEEVSERSEVEIPEIEEIMLQELWAMGFKQRELNRQVLRKNEYDLEQSVNDLCDTSECDPILLELQAMGFKDKETNKRLLAKNNGSLTHVVMDLIAEE